ncbi:MAG: glycosyltransferase [Cyclobacteriaceae bacterium]|nr:glycosyltransferase [Cyclobacteriaceae bacterium]
MNVQPKSRLKVIRVTTVLNFGGVERNFELHAKYHNKNDYDLIIVSLQTGGRASTFIGQQGIRVITMNLNFRTPSLNCVFQLWKLFRKERPDVVHTSCGEGNLHGLIAAWLAGVPVRIGEEIGIPSHSRVATFIFRLVYSTAHRVIGISRSVSRYLAMHETSREKIDTIYYPIDIGTSFNRDNSKKDRFVIVTLCRLEAVKNLSMLLKLLGTLAKKNEDRKFELWLIGDGSLKESLRTEAEQLGLRDQVTFYGYQERPQEILVKADLFILPSFTEGFGLACIEAIQCGLPVIVTSSGGMVEYITDGVNGFLFDPHTFDQLLSRTEQVMQLSEEEIKTMNTRALTTVNDLFSPAKYLSELNRIYRLQGPPNFRI